MKTIFLTQGYSTIVDDHNAFYLAGFKWCAFKNRNGIYVIRFITIDGKYQRIFMHNEILITLMGLSIPSGMICDHIDQNSLNNQESNLRIATHSLNSFNSKIQSNNTSGYRGICWHKEVEKWIVRITVNWKRINLGYYSDLQEAIEVRRAAELKYFGEILT